MQGNGVAVGVGAVLGEWSPRDTVATGAVLAMVRPAEVLESVAVPSDTVTCTVMVSPLSPLPAVARFSEEPVAPEMGLPFLNHW